MRTCIPVIEVANVDQAQALANFLWNEQQRHWEDIQVIRKDLEKLRSKWLVEPTCEVAFIVP